MGRAIPQFTKHVNHLSVRKLVLFLLITAAVISFTVPAALVLSQSADQQVVIDDAGIFGNQIGDVESAANQLISRGADVRVRTIQTYGSSGNLDQYEAQLERQSPSWQAADGSRKNNLIVLIIALQERQTGLYYGSEWTDILDNNWLRIQTDIMNPSFRSGDYDGGTAAGLQEIMRLIQSGGQPTTTTSPSGSAFSPALLVILIIIALVVGFLLFRSSHNNRAKRQAARQRAMLAKQGAASGINELTETIQMLEIKVDATADKVLPDEAAALRSSFANARRLVNQS